MSLGQSHIIQILEDGSSPSSSRRKNEQKEAEPIEDTEIEVKIEDNKVEDDSERKHRKKKKKN